MSVGAILSRAIGKQLFDFANTTLWTRQIQPQRTRVKLVRLPDPSNPGINSRRVVHFKDEYTVEPLEVTNRAGRDPVSGRVVVGTLGGGIKHKYHWIQFGRYGPTDINEKPKEEKVLDILVDGNRTAHVALVGCGKELKYYLATENMKPGMIIRTHSGIPKNPVRPAEGDAYPLGALPSGAVINCIEKIPGQGGVLIHAAGSCATVESRTSNEKVVVKVASGQTFALDPRCMATVGRLSNVEHGSKHIGSAQNLRLMGRRPRSGLWHKKDGRFGRKIKKPKILTEFSKKQPNHIILKLSSPKYD